jgi:hypothetical protein
VGLVILVRVREKLTTDNHARGDARKDVDAMIKTKAKCRVCGKITALRQPYGEGTDFLPRRHKINGVQCPGSVREAELIDFIDGKIVDVPASTHPAPAAEEAQR